MPDNKNLLKSLRMTLVLLLCDCFLLTSAQQSCSAYFYPGSDDVDIKFAAILGIQEQKDGGCSGQYLEPILKRAVALNWVVDLLNGGGNASRAFIQGIRFGIDIYDDCYSEYLAARHAGAIASYILGNNECDVRAEASQSRPPIAGVIGTSSSQTTTVVVDMMKQTNVPIVGVSATLPELSNKTRYPAFVRTIPSDFKQAQVIIEIAKEFKWSYVIGVHTNDNYGTQGMAEVKRLALENGICVTHVEEFKLGAQLTTEQMEFFVRKTLFTKIDSTTGSIGVIYFGTDGPLKELLSFIKLKRSSWTNALNYLRKIHWIATDGVTPAQELGDLVVDYGTKFLLLGPVQLQMKSFEDYFKKVLQEPPAWLTGQWRLAWKYVVDNTYKCANFNFTKDPPCDTNNKGNENGYMTAALDAVYLLANTLKTIFKAACDTKPDTCSYFREILHTGILKTNSITDLDYGSLDAHNIPPEFSKPARSLKKVSGDFEAVNQTLFSIKANKDSSSFVEIGNYNGQKVNIYDTSNSIVEPSQCKGKCVECAHIDDIDYIYSHGKYIIIGLFSIHQHSDDNPFGCGEYRSQSLSYIASNAFLTAVGYLNNVTDLDFGYLLMDDCYNSLMSSQKLIKMLSGEMSFVDKKTGAVFQPSSVVVVIGAQSSMVTMSLLPNLQNFGIPMISYSATNPALDNGINYPYFLRTVSTDTIQAKAIVAILIELNVSRVGAIVIDNMYGLGLYDIFRNYAEAEKICVENATTVNENTDSKLLDPTLKRYRIEDIKVVVTIVTDQAVGIILDAVNIDDVFVFIASEGWGPNPLVTASRRKKARGALVLGAYSPELPDYGLKSLLKSMDPYSESNNGWLKDLWQQQFQCYLPGGFNNIYTTQCPHRTDGSYFNDSVITTLVRQPLPVHATIATLSAGLALKSLINSKPVAGQSWKPDPSTFIKTIRSFQLTPSTGSLQDLSKAGFQIYSIQHKGDLYDYTYVGTYRGNGSLVLQKQQIKFYNELGQTVDYVTSSCRGRTGCMVCGADSPTSPTTQTSTQPYVVAASGGHDGTITALAVIVAVLCLVIIVLMIVVVLRARGLMPCKRDKYYEAQNPNIANRSGSSHVTPPNLNAAGDIDEDQINIESGNQGRPGLPPRKSDTPTILRNMNVSDANNSNLSDLSNHSVVSWAKSGSQQGSGAHGNRRASGNINMTEFPSPKAHSPMQSDRPNYSSSSGSAISQFPPAVVVETQSKKPTQEVQPLHPSLPSDTSSSGVSGSSGEIIYTMVRPTTLGEEVKSTPSKAVGKTDADPKNQPEYLRLLNSVQQSALSPPGDITNSGQPNFVYVQTPEGIFLVSVPPSNQDYSFRDNKTEHPVNNRNGASSNGHDPPNPEFVYDNEGYITPLESPYQFFQHPITFLPSSDYGRRQDCTFGSEGTLDTTPIESNDFAPGEILGSPGQRQGKFVPQQQFPGVGAVNDNGQLQGTFLPQQFAGVGAVNHNEQHQGKFVPQQQFAGAGAVNQNGQLQVMFVPQQQYAGGGAVNQNGDLQGTILQQQHYAGGGAANQNNPLQGVFLPQQQFFLQLVNPQQKNIPQLQYPRRVAALQQTEAAMVHHQASGVQMHQRPSSLPIAPDSNLIHRVAAPGAAHSQIQNKNANQQESPGVSGIQNTAQGRTSSAPNISPKDANGNEQNIQGKNKGLMTTAAPGQARTPPGSTKVKESADGSNSRSDTPEGSPVHNLPMVSSPATTLAHPGPYRLLDVVEEVDDTNISMV
ncbi:unnamed protein product [Lymnaea stagnalis]|uniref:Receptor ligand binding region domain-containing protein n=1 Tax=Lymnaea stagnalis TaxID=6523 RepID=A0AAV2IDY3_LYMST